MLGSNVRQYGMVLALATIVVFFQFQTAGVLLKPLNVSNLLTQNSYILILAIGMVMVIISRHIDLSVGSVAAFVGAVSAIMMTKWDLPWFLAVVLCLGLGALIGAWHGFWVAYVGIPAFIVTLASMLIFRGLTLTVLNGQTVANLPPHFEAMGNGFLPEVGPDTGLHNLTMLLGAVMSVFVIWVEVRRRASATRYSFEVAPRPLLKPATHTLAPRPCSAIRASASSPLTPTAATRVVPIPLFSLGSISATNVKPAPSSPARPKPAIPRHTA